MAQLESFLERRHDQIYPTLDPRDLERVRRFADVHSFAIGESLWTIGQAAPGLMVILAGTVAVTERDQFDNHKPLPSTAGETFSWNSRYCRAVRRSWTR